MIKKLLPIVLLFASTGVFAQPVLTAVTSNPEVNDEFESTACDSTGISPMLGGIDITWDYHTLLTPASYITPNKDTASVVVFGATSPGYSAMTALAGIAGPNMYDSSTFAITTPSGLGTSYVKSNSDKVSQTGIYFTSTNFAVYTDPMDQMRYPFSYLSVFSDTYSGALITSVGGSVTTAVETGTITVAADGWGTLVVPGATYPNVLRVHTSQFFKDSANLFGIGTNVVFDLETYAWYQPGYHSPVMSISTATNTTFGFKTKTVSYASRQIANHDAVPTVKGLDNSLSLYPNPTSSYIYMSYNNADNQKVRTTIIDMLGREVAVVADQATQGLTRLTYNAATLAKGSYILKMQSDNETVTRKFVVQ